MSDEKGYLFGIDLGTTYSCISYMGEDGKPVVCKSSEGEDTFPSVVRLLPDEEPVAGRTAKDQAVIYPDHTISFIKKVMGRVSEYEYGPEDDRRTTTPEEVSAEILKKLAKDAGDYTNTVVKHAVITVPAYFGQTEKLATKKAGELAGLVVDDIIEEPTAAAFYYGTQNSDHEENVCIYDLGGGTFDVTVMKVSPTELQEITKDGNHDLGGKQWDDELIQLVKTKFCEATDYDEEFETDILQDLYVKCEAAKKQLSSTEKTSVALNIDRAHRANIEITRQEFEDATAYLLQESIDLTKKVFDIVKEKGISIDKILLVGGSSYMPQVKAALQNEFGMEPLMNEPNEAVSKGACIYNNWKIAHMAVNPDPTPNQEDTDGPTVVGTSDNGDGTSKVTIDDGSGNKTTVTVFTLDGANDMKITRCASKSYGIKCRVNGEEKIFNLIKKDDVMDGENGITHKETFGTYREGQTGVGIELFQNESREENCELDEGVTIGNAELTGLPAGLPKGEPVDIYIVMSASGIITVTGSHNGTPLEGKLDNVMGEISEN